MIGREEFRAYSEAVAAVADEAARAVEERVLAWLAGNPGATVAEAREAAKAVMAEVAPAYDDAAAALAAEWYDERAEAAHVKLPAAVTETTYSDDMADRVARYQAAKLEAGDIEGFARACGEFAANAAKRTVNATVMANAGRDRAKGARFARVPTGKETCSFCLMLASRGAVYLTRRTAGEFNHFHRRCDCKVVPGFEDDPMAVLVEGCDPAEYYDRWKHPEKYSDGSEPGTAAKREPIHVGKSVGAAFYARRVKDIDGKVVELEVDTDIENVEVIAGRGHRRKIDDIKFLQEKYGGAKDDWQKAKGIGKVRVNGMVLDAELHWYEMEFDSMTYEIKVVRYLV